MDCTDAGQRLLAWAKAWIGLRHRHGLDWAKAAVLLAKGLRWPGLDWSGLSGLDLAPAHHHPALDLAPSPCSQP